MSVVEALLPYQAAKPDPDFAAIYGYKPTEPHAPGYPSHSDRAGRARIYYAGKTYHLGMYGSPKSYIMYGIWLHELQRTGNPPAMKTVRRIRLETDFNGRERAMAIYSFTGLLCATLVGLTIAEVMK